MLTVDLTTVTLRARDAAADLISHLPQGQARPLAEPPPGSGLQPVMGEPGLPVLGQMLGFLADPLGQARTGYERYGTVSWGQARSSRYSDRTASRRC